MLFAGVGFWLIGFTSAYALGFPLGLGAYGIWIGLTLGLFVYASLLIWRFHLLTARRYLPPVADTDAEAASWIDDERQHTPLRSAAG
jgi:MATE family multidrug resistance protein